MKRKIFVLDTNVLLHDPNSLLSFQENHVIVILPVLEELDTFKTNHGELGANSRRVAHIIDEARRNGDITTGVEIGENGLLSVIESTCCEKDNFKLAPSVDNELLHTTFALSQKQNATLVTRDINLRIKADVLNINAEDYTTDKKNVLYDGYDEIEISEDEMEDFHQCGHLTVSKPESLEKLVLNQYYQIHLGTGGTEITLGRCINENTITLIDWTNQPVVGITPRNIEQHILMDALLDNDIKLVTIHGKAGTGKTLLAIASAVYKTFVNYDYTKIRLMRPVIPVGRDIGFLPGGLEEKMTPWMAPFYDNLDFLKQEDRKSGHSVLPINFDESELIEISPLSYIRGQSVANSFIIVDEAQNLTPLDIKTIVTRAGLGTKIVFTGDIDQIDHAYLSYLDNGLTYLASKFRGNPLHCHITLKKGERSELAEYATNLL